jgi:hypothetical protein
MKPTACSEGNALRGISTDSPGLVHLPADSPSGDRERTVRRYAEAAKELEEALNGRLQQWVTISIPEFDNISELGPLHQIQIEIDKALDARKSSITNKNIWSKGKKTMEQVFRAFSPFAKNILGVVKAGSSVRT